MIVGLFNDSFPPVVDGVSRVVTNYASELTKNGDRAVVVVPYFPGISDDYPYEVYSFRSHGLPIRREYRWGIAAADISFRRKVKRIPFDIIHTHCPFSSHIIGHHLAKTCSVPLVTTFHTKFRDDFKEALKVDAAANFFVNRIVKAYNASDEVWTVNEASIETLRGYGYMGDIVVMPNGCDIEPSDRTPELRRELLNEYSLPDAPIFTFVGRLVPQKNLPLLLDALKILHDRGGDYCALIVGEGEELDELKKRVQDDGMASKVRFTGAVRDREKLKKIYLSSALAILPSLYDTSSLVPREAAACLCPTLFLTGSSTAQGIVDGQNGFLANPDARSIALKLEEVIGDKNVLDATSRGARETLYMPWSESVARARERYQMLIDKKKPRFRLF